MYTQCPQCRTIFEISEDALQASLGIVRCGHCAERFDALRTLSDSLPADPEAALPEHDPNAVAPTLTTAVPPAAVQAAATPSRELDVPETETQRGGSVATQDDEAWFDVLAGNRARALIADAAGIPPEVIQADPAWQLTDPPVQARFAELDIIPMAAGVPASDSDAPEVITPAAAETGRAESEPFTGAWGLDVPGADVGEATSFEESMASDKTEPPTRDHDEADSAEDIAAADPLAGAETEFGPDTWFPEDRFDADGALPPNTVATDEAIPASAESRDEPHGDEAEAHHEQPGDEEPATTAPPIYVPPRRRVVRRSDWLWAAGCAVLALALAAQVAWASRVALVRDPATQGQALRVCARFDCRLPPIRDLPKLELLSRDIRPDPDASGALAITATFRNNAPYRQPWPVVVVELTDLDGNVVAMRRFRPVEYMPDAARRAAGIAAGSTAAVAFEVADPGKRAVSFHFGFD